MKVLPVNYITVCGWMRSELHLNGNELLLYALIYGFSQEENQWCESGLQYICDWLGVNDKSNVRRIISRLVDKGVIIKQDELINGVKFCKYRAVLPRSQNDHHPVVKTTTNNIDIVSTKVETVRENNTPCLFEDNIGDTTPYNPPTTSEQEQMFDEFRRAYRGTKRGLRTEFENFRKKHKDWRDVLVHLLADYQRQVQVLDANKAAGAFVPQPKNLQTYINQRCWEEEITLLTPQTQSDYARQSFDREVAKQRGQIAARATTRRAVLDAAIQSINAERGITPDY